MDNKAEVINFQPFEPGDANDARRIATAAVVDRVNQVLFYFFSEKEEGIEEDEGKMEEFAEFTWAIACSALNSVGLRIIGVDNNGNYVATLSPCESVKTHLMTSDIGEEEDFYFEDALDSPEYQYAGFISHEEDLLGE